MHPHVDETFYLLEGEIAVHLDGEDRRLSVGAAAAQTGAIEILGPPLWRAAPVPATLGRTRAWARRSKWPPLHDPCGRAQARRP